MTDTANLIEMCRHYCPSGTRPSAEEAMVLISEIDRLNAEIERLRAALTEILDGYGPKHGSNWCRTRALAALGRENA